MVRVEYSSGSESYVADNSATFTVWRNGQKMTVTAAQLQTGDYWLPNAGQPPVLIDGPVTVT